MVDPSLGEAVVGEEVEVIVLVLLHLSALSNDECNGFCRNDVEHKKHARGFTHARDDMFIKFRGLCHRIVHVCGMSR